MSLILKRQSDGRIMARNDGGPELFLLSRSRRVANRKTFEVRHYMVPSLGMVIWALKGLSMSMLHNAASCGANEFGRSGRGGGAAKPVYYEGKLFMVCADIQRYGEAMLLGPDGRVCAGSNTFDHGKLCLGSALDPLTLSPVDALCFNNANRDLAWQGAPLTGEWERNPDPENPRSRAANQIFKVTNWPTWTPPSSPLPLLPPQVLAATVDW